jgi:hypothetical protein
MVGDNYSDMARIGCSIYRLAISHDCCRAQAPRASVRLPLSIRREIDATLFGCVEAARHEPDAVLTPAEVALAYTVAQREGAFNKGTPLRLSYPLIFDWLRERNRGVGNQPFT